jgi:hypothetical protein
MKLFWQIFLIFLINITLTGCSLISVEGQGGIDNVLKQEPAVIKDEPLVQVPVPEIKGETISDNNIKKEDINNNEKEEKVIVSISNFGRDNPFKPFKEKSLVSNWNMANLPPPPMYAPDPEIEELLKVKINGILYDPKLGSSAIININENDYLVHKGDLIFNYLIKNITIDKVVIKQGNNEYKAGIGEIIGEVNANPVTRGTSIISKTQTSSLPEIKMVTPTYTAALNNNFK